MDIRPYQEYREEEIAPLYAAVGWTAYTDDLASLKKGFENSLLILAAYEEERLIGLIRAVGDGYTIVFIQDILVHPQYQRQGIGTALLRSVMERYQYVRQLQLTTDDTPKTISFYQSLGFKAHSDLGCRGFMRI